jgi:ribosomal protein L16/L10AE
MPLPYPEIHESDHPDRKERKKRMKSGAGHVVNAAALIKPKKTITNPLTLSKNDKGQRASQKLKSPSSHPRRPPPPWHSQR